MERSKAKDVYDSKAFKEAQVKYYDETTNQNYWIAACLNNDWIGLSRDMVVKEHISKVKRFILQEDSPLMGIKYYTHHCPVCDGIVFNPKEALSDPLYEFNSV